MSYANATVTPAERAKAATTVIGIHALIGAGLIAGLAVTTIVVEPVDDTLEGGEVLIEVPPPPEPDTVEDPVPQPRDNIYVPPSPLPVPNPDPVQTAPEPPEAGPPLTNPGTEQGPRPTSTPSTAPSPTPSPTIAAVGARPTNGPAGWITTNDYPDRDLRRGNEGSGSYRLTIGTNGRVTGCEMTSSTGHRSLDRQTCRVIRRVARFSPATDTTGARVTGTYTGSVTWQIPE